MRISDWSSDVCSSDLCIRPERGGEHGEQSTRLAIGNYRIVQTVHPFFSSKDERQEAAANGSTSLSRNGNRDIIAKLKVRRECPQLRSEEHTSELQSLMRISYAVFCLKKKNKEITNVKNSITHTQKTIKI